MSPEASQHPTSPEQVMPPMDALLHAEKLRQAVFNPEAVFHQAKEAGFAGEEQELADAVNRQRQEATKEIIAPETVAEMSRLSEKRTAEEVGYMLQTTRSRLNNFEEITKPIGRNIGEIGDQLYSAKRSVNELEEMLHTRRMDPDAIRQAGHKLEVFHEVYEGSTRKMSAIYEDASAEVRVAAVNARDASEQADNGRAHLVRGKNELQDNPGNAYFDGAEEAVENRGATTVAEHQASCQQEYATRLERIADLRDDAHDLSGSLMELSHKLPGAQALAELPKARQIGDVVYEIRTLGYWAQEGRLHPGQLEEIVGRLKMDLRKVEHGLEGMTNAQRTEAQSIEAAQDNVRKVLSSEIFQN